MTIAPYTIHERQQNRPLIRPPQWRLPKFKPERMQQSGVDTPPTHPPTGSWTPIHANGRQDSTYLGRVPTGKTVEVELRGEWYRTCGSNETKRSVDYTGRDFGFTYQGHIQVLSAADGITVLRDFPWTGQPITISDEGCYVVVPVLFKSDGVLAGPCPQDTSEARFTINP